MESFKIIKNGDCAKKQREKITGDMWIRQEKVSRRQRRAETRLRHEARTEIRKIISHKRGKKRQIMFTKCQSVNPDLILTKNGEQVGGGKLSGAMCHKYDTYRQV